MLVSCWSTKGGAGTTVVAAALALLVAEGHDLHPRRHRRLRAVGAGTGAGIGAVLADLTGDGAVVLGRSHLDGGPGLAAWLAAAPDVPADALGRIEEAVGDGLALLRRGDGPLDPRAADLLAGVLNADPRTVVADCGRLSPDDEGGASAVGTALAAGATRSLLVVRPCFLALRRAVAAPVRPSGVVLVAEEGRALTAHDVEDALGVPVVARVRVTERIARAVDCGLLSGRLPRSLAEDLQHAA